MHNNNYDLSFWKGKKVFVTGHTGFKGSWLSLLLLSLGSDVGGFSLPLSESIEENKLYKDLHIDSDIQSCYADLRSFDKLKDSISLFQPDIVFHLAAQPLVRVSYQNPRDTWESNVIGSLNTLESVRLLEKQCTVIVITTDKVYSNLEWSYGYRETDMLGGNDPYSSSKAAVELLVNSWISSFTGDLKHQSSGLRIATARAGNVLGGGDWAKDRIIPDLVRSLSSNTTVNLRNPYSRRPWQHVLDPLRGYLMLAELVHGGNTLGNNCAVNFGPEVQSCKSVEQLITSAISYWKGSSIPIKIESPQDNYHESRNLMLSTDKAYELMSWTPSFDFEQTVKATMEWYYDVDYSLFSPLECCMKNIREMSSRLSEF